MYAGYGRKSDFDLLAEKGESVSARSILVAEDVEIDVSGKIVIVKYGANFRGLKIKGDSITPFIGRC